MQNNTHQTNYKRYFLPTVEIKDYNIIIDGRKFLDRDCYCSRRWLHTNGCLLDYHYFKENYKLIAVSNQEVSKQEELDADPKVTQQNDFTGNIDRAEVAWVVFILEEVKETILSFSQETIRVQ